VSLFNCRRRLRSKKAVNAMNETERQPSISITRRGRRKAVRWAAARWNRCAGNCKGRFKRGGQFWTEPGRRLMALEVGRRNHGWDQVWQLN
jgi:hypothetical protein